MMSENPLLSNHWRSWALLLLFAPFTLLQLSFSRPRPIDLSDHDKQIRRAKIAPTSLPTIRKRALSAPLEKPERVGFLRWQGQVTDDQSLCPLFSKLPAEIRNQIWVYALGGHKLRVLKGYRRLGYVRCRHVGERCPDDCVGYYDANWYKEAPSLTGCIDDVSGFENEENEKDGFLNLSLTCRLIYSETIDLLYSQNDFAVRDLDCLTYLSTTLLPQRFHRIHTLQVNWCVSGWGNSILSPRATPPYDWGSWKSIWNTVASMKGLKVLRVGLTTRRLGGLTADEEYQLFRPFREMRHVERIEIVTSWCPTLDGGHLQMETDQRLIIERVDEVVVDNPPWTFEW